MDPKTIEELIKNHFDCQIVEVQGEDRTHYEALVVSAEFEGQMKIKRHRMIYAALGDHMISDIHALSIKAYTPEEHNNL